MRRPGRHAAYAVALSVGLLSVACRGGDDPPAPECVTELVTDVTFDLEPAAAAPQVYADTAFDGSTVWLAYSRPDEEGVERRSVFLRRIHCDGTAASLSMRVNTTQSSNNLAPSIAVADGTIAVTWTADSGVGAHNLDAMYRTWGTNHDPRMLTDIVLETEYGGEPVVGNVAAPEVAAVGNGQFAVAGVRTFEATGRSQAFVQRVDTEGNLVGDAVDGQLEAVDHSMPTIAAEEDGALHFAWVRSPAIDEYWVVHTKIGADADLVAPNPPVTATPGVMGLAPSYALGPDGHAYLAFNTPDSEIILVLASGFDGGATTLTLGESNGTESLPRAAAATGGGALAWYRNISGYSYQLVVQRFTYDGATLLAGASEVLDTVTPYPYPPAIAHVRDSVFFVAWSEWVNPEVRMKGRFVQLD